MANVWDTLEETDVFFYQTLVVFFETEDLK